MIHDELYSVVCRKPGLRVCLIMEGFFLVLIGIMFPTPANAALRLPSILSDGMVLQRDRELTIWGWAAKGATVKIAIADRRGEGTVGDDGRWSVKIGKLASGGPHEMQIETSNGEKVTIKDVLVGEVWLCSGQSNMELPLGGKVDNSEKEVAAVDYPRIRLFKVGRIAPPKPAKNILPNRQRLLGVWSSCAPDAVRNFSAVGYYFGRELHKELNVPIGLIDSSFGATWAENWISCEGLEQAGLLYLVQHYDEQSRQLVAWQAAVAEAKAGGQPAPPRPIGMRPPRPTALYNGMIAPLTPYAIAGVIWYQGEGNVARAYQYRALFPALIQDWRHAFGQPDMPFYFVQIAPFNYGTFKLDPRACAELWEAQLLTLKNVPHTGMAVINDISDVKNIHPTNKAEVGRRLALWALARTYGKKDVVFSGPVYKSFEVRDNSIVLTVDHVGAGLVSRDGKPLNHFEIAGENQKFVPATATIEGNTIVVHSDAVSNPVAVRFAWRDTAVPNLMNREGLPASSFRTDSWKGVTEGKELP